MDMNKGSFFYILIGENERLSNKHIFFISEVPEQVILGKIIKRIRNLIKEESMRCIDLVHLLHERFLLELLILHPLNC